MVLLFLSKKVTKFYQQSLIKFFVRDLRKEKTEEIKHLYGATVVDPNEISSVDINVFYPCALGGILNNSTIPIIKAFIIADSANNQLEDEEIHSRLLASKDILYCPDYVINTGGLIAVYNEMLGYSEEKALKQLNNIYGTLLEIFRKSEKEGITTHEAAKCLAEQRIIKAKNKKLMDNYARLRC
jgi:leucine dehydrogenase